VSVTLLILKAALLILGTAIALYVALRFPEEVAGEVSKGIRRRRDAA